MVLTELGLQTAAPASVSCCASQHSPDRTGPESGLPLLLSTRIPRPCSLPSGCALVSCCCGTNKPPQSTVAHTATATPDSARRSVIWTWLCGSGLSLFQLVSAETLRRRQEDTLQDGSLTRMTGRGAREGPMFSSVWVSLQLLGLPHNMAAGVPGGALAREPGPGAWHLYHPASDATTLNASRQPQTPAQAPGGWA